MPAEPPRPLRLDEVRDHLSALGHDTAGVPSAPFVLVDLDTRVDDPAAVEDALRRAEVVAVGVATRAPAPAHRGIVDALACSLTTDPRPERTFVTVADPAAAAARLQGAVTGSPKAALAMRRLVEATTRLPVREGLSVESAVYSMLLAGEEFAGWLAGRTRRAVPARDGDAVELARAGDELHVRLSVPERRNAFSRQLRDGMIEAFELALTDSTISTVVLTGAGPAFCSGGDLNEFGTSTDVSAAHVVRLQRSAALRAHELGARLEVRLHGACIGAGVEIPSFAGRVVARDDARFALPELGMGLVPGAGGTVGITRRVGRWRCAWLHLSGESIGVDVALAWGLVDERG
ncbi:enoyl-CoA hydratase/isomerase family protein [uncultured Jatrophihabitans sp.]|uniref:enoyl-CoA hydratase/isomerase family protein n=1 Tax=uncultured Jatrophihabitans sp. TaxID=1610747 RepID=UPI0035CA58CC